MTERVQRYDNRGRLGKVTRTPQGGFKVAAKLRKTGVLVYRNPDGSERRELVRADELFSLTSIASLANAPVSNLHPDTMVGPENYQAVTVGHLVGDVRTDETSVSADLLIQAATAIEAVDSGKRNEVSCGYVCSFLPTPGVTAEGERYDGVQANILYNHVALVPRGRAGRDVCLRLDSNGNQEGPIVMSEPTKLRIEILDGVEYEVGTPAHAKARSLAEGVRNDAAEALTKVTAERDAFKAELDGHAARFDAAVTERVELLRVAESRGVECEGSNTDIRAALLAKVSPSLKFDASDDVYVKAALDVALATGNLTEVAKAVVTPTEVRTDSRTAIAPDVLARENMIRRQTNRPAINRFGETVSK